MQSHVRLLPYTVKPRSNEFEGTNHFHLLLSKSVIANIYRIKEKLVLGPKVESVGVRFLLLLGQLEKSSTVSKKNFRFSLEAVMQYVFSKNSLSHTLPIITAYPTCPSVYEGRSDLTPHHIEVSSCPAVISPGFTFSCFSSSLRFFIQLAWEIRSKGGFPSLLSCGLIDESIRASI